MTRSIWTPKHGSALPVLAFGLWLLSTAADARATSITYVIAPGPASSLWGTVSVEGTFSAGSALRVDALHLHGSVGIPACPPVPGAPTCHGFQVVPFELLLDPAIESTFLLVDVLGTPRPRGDIHVLLRAAPSVLPHDVVSVWRVNILSLLLADPPPVPCSTPTTCYFVPVLNVLDPGGIAIDGHLRGVLGEPLTGALADPLWLRAEGVAVPEPATALLVGLCVLALGEMRRGAGPRQGLCPQTCRKTRV